MLEREIVEPFDDSEKSAALYKYPLTNQVYYYITQANIW